MEMDFLLIPEAISEPGSFASTCHGVGTWELSLPLSDKASADSLSTPVLITSCYIKSPKGGLQPLLSIPLYIPVASHLEMKVERFSCELRQVEVEPADVQGHTFARPGSPSFCDFILLLCLLAASFHLCPLSDSAALYQGAGHRAPRSPLKLSCGTSRLESLTLKAMKGRLHIPGVQICVINHTLVVQRKKFGCLQVDKVKCGADTDGFTADLQHQSCVTLHLDAGKNLI